MAPSPSALSYIQRSCGIRAGGQSLGHFFMLDFSTRTRCEAPHPSGHGSTQPLPSTSSHLSLGFPLWETWISWQTTPERPSAGIWGEI